MILRSRALAALLMCWMICACGSGSGRQEKAEVERLREAARRKNLVMILLDAGSYAHFGFAGYDRATTTNVDSLASASLVFDTAYGPAASTGHSVYAMLTSTYPFLAEQQGLKGIRDAAFRVTEDTQLMAELLAPRFPRRIAISSNAWFGPEFGFDRGFTEFHATYVPEDDEEAPRRHAERALEFFEQDLEMWGEGPTFTYIHFLEPHTPYTPPDEYARRFDPVAADSIDARSRPLMRYRVDPPDQRHQDMIRALYDANLAYVDSAVGRLLDALREKDLSDNTIVLLIADHGEAFWQHGVWGHGRHVYDEFVRIPFTFEIPGVDLVGRHIAEPVSLVDLLPTYLDLFSLPVPSILKGNSLLPLIAGDTADFESRPVFVRNTHGDVPEFGVRSGRYKWIFKVNERRHELYDLETDPAEHHDLVAANAVPPEARPLQDELALWLATGTERIEPMDEIDPETYERLRALGYF